MIVLILLCCLCAAVPAYFYARNQSQFQRAPMNPVAAPPISVLVPARNEAANIVECLDCLTSSNDIELEVLVLDDHSTDNTAELVERYAQIDSRVRLVSGKQLPPGWNGKQHACWQLANEAAHPWLVFIDADVRLEPEALARATGMAATGGIDLLSGFPRQITRTLLERLLLPLIHFVLLGFLSLRAMRESLDPRFGAGCGQWFIANREAYFAAGGHAAIRHSRHDGLLLPRLFRAHGWRTDIFDATDTARCRMYDGARATWQGLAKNATEGIANLPMLPIVSIVLALGQVAPLPLFCYAIFSGAPFWQSAWLGASVLLSYAPRLHAAWRYKQSLLGALLHPLAIVLFLAIQWEALVRDRLGKPVAWKGRVELPHRA
jgi:hypothetical protein